MAGRGPLPKAAERLSRPSSAAARRSGMHVLPRAVERQPELPDDVDWPERTRRWWQVWARTPLSADFTGTDWSFLLDTAFLHARFWDGEVKLAAELRLREAKLGATPEDRARLRITFAAADEAEERRDQRGARTRRGTPTDPREALRVAVEGGAS